MLREIPAYLSRTLCSLGRRRRSRRCGKRGGLLVKFQHIAGMSDSNSPSSDNPNDAQCPSVSATAQLNSCQVSEIGPAAAPRASHTPRRQGSPTPPPSRRPLPSPASSYALVLRSVPAIQKWTVASLRQALSNADVYYSRWMKKTELYNIFCSIQSSTSPAQSTPPPRHGPRPHCRTLV
ncbi:hypothetical protein Q8A67_000137 [Cirrhinus molitorella]|uniref:Uncharacterized protein n=1 Tax=Cirrhinus molitorella TaxID=172907 RepID=A0AA88Q4U4_9TELE|nr:hypothetical protein Q8A67_000137 [Cirrhinus molitorella]